MLSMVPPVMDIDSTVKAFTMVGIAEIFDKTWFVALLMALKYDKTVVFWSCFLALAAHVILAAIFGVAATKLVPVQFLHFGAAALYAYFGILFWKDYQDADPDSDIIAAGKEEAAEDCEDVDQETQNYGAVDPNNKKAQTPQKSSLSKVCKLFGACFVAMFIAEWGDRTQIAMLGLHASDPVLPVVVGSLVAFFILTLSAVIVGGILGDQKISEKMTHLVSCISFVVFALLAVHDGLSGEPVDMR